MLMRATVPAFGFALAAAPVPAVAADFGINLYGLSYHFDRGRARELGMGNGFNPGLGLRYRVSQSERLQWIFDAGVYHDSGRNTAALAGAGALWRLGGGWHFGAALAAFQSNTYNHGEPFIAPVPLAAYEFRSATLNFTFLPQVAEVNEVATFGAWLTWWWR
jgi:hypothetical protein